MLGPLSCGSCGATSRLRRGAGKEALNFNITVLFGAIVCALLDAGVHRFILLGTALFIAWLVMTLIAAIKASEGSLYRYPFSLRLVK